MPWYAKVYKSAFSDNIKYVGLQLRAVIQQVFKSSLELPWPCTINDILDLELPEDLQHFLNFVDDGQPSGYKQL